MIDLTREKWIVIDGSVYTERSFKEKSAIGTEYWTRKAIAYNVPKLADHLVKLQNSFLEQKVVKTELKST